MLDRLGKCIKLSVSAESISCQEFASQFGLAICLYAKNILKKSRGNRVASEHGYLNSQRSALSQAERTVTVGRHRIAIACAADGDGGDGGDGCLCVGTCVRACVRTRVRVCVYARACVHA